MRELLDLVQDSPRNLECCVALGYEADNTRGNALETAQWSRMPFPIKDVSNLNPLDMGEFAGMDLGTIRENDPDWLKELEQEPFHTRYVGS